MCLFGGFIPPLKHHNDTIIPFDQLNLVVLWWYYGVKSFYDIDFI